MKNRKRRKGNAKRFLSILLTVVMMLLLASENTLAFAAYAKESAIEESVEGKSAEESDEKELEETGRKVGNTN